MYWYLPEFKGGWIIGPFSPAILNTDQFELAIKEYRAGDAEASHHHKVADEYTVVVRGRVRMLDRVFGPGEIIKIPPGYSTSFEALEDTITVVVKIPGVQGDKYVD